MSLKIADFFFYFVESGGGFDLSFFGACGEDLLEVAFLCDDLCELFSGLREVLEDFGQEEFFGVAVAEAAGGVLFCELFLFFWSGEELVEVEDITSLGIFGIFNAFGIGNNAHDLLFELGFRGENVDCVAIGFTHLLAVGAGDYCYLFFDVWLGKLESLSSECLIEGGGDVAGHFDVLFLVLAYRDEVWLI